MDKAILRILAHRKRENRVSVKRQDLDALQEIVQELEKPKKFPPEFIMNQERLIESVVRMNNKLCFKKARIYESLFSKLNGRRKKIDNSESEFSALVTRLISIERIKPLFDDDIKKQIASTSVLYQILELTEPDELLASDYNTEADELLASDNNDEEYEDDSADSHGSLLLHAGTVDGGYEAIPAPGSNTDTAPAPHGNRAAVIYERLPVNSQEGEDMTLASSRVNTSTISSAQPLPANPTVIYEKIPNFLLTAEQKAAHDQAQEKLKSNPRYRFQAIVNTRSTQVAYHGVDDDDDQTAELAETVLKS